MLELKGYDRFTKCAGDDVLLVVVTFKVVGILYRFDRFFVVCLLGLRLRIALMV